MHSARPASDSVRASTAPLAANAAAAELFATLAAAFRPPPAPLRAAEWCELLAGDLHDLGATLWLDTTVAECVLSEHAVGDSRDQPWLVEYSRLFLVPPVRITLNTGLYLEGTLGGASAQMMLQCYGAAGFGVAESFGDLPDHVSLQLEFIAALLRRAEEGDDNAVDMAREFIEGFLDHWSAPLLANCQKHADRDPAAKVYAALAELLSRATLLVARS